ncbi:MAG: hypothetical protein ABFC34_00335 [Methanobacterium sp.]
MAIENNDSNTSKNVHIIIDETNPILVARTPTEDELMYAEWGVELLKKRIDFANEYLRHILTLNVAVIGLYITLVDKKMANLNFAKLILFFFFTSLFLSFLGLLPTEKVVCYLCPKEIKEMINKTYRKKTISIWLSSFTFFLGILLLSANVFNLI